MQRYQQLAELFLKHTPEVNRVATSRQLEQTGFSRMEDRQIDPVLRYMESLQVHREYLDFFQIGVYRDQRSKIEQVAKYVGLAIRPYEPPFMSAPAPKAS